MMKLVLMKLIMTNDLSLFKLFYMTNKLIIAGCWTVGLAALAIWCVFILSIITNVIL